MGYTLVAMATRLPVLAVLVVGMALLIRRRARHSSRVVALGLAGMAVLIASTLGGALPAIYRTELLRLDISVVGIGQLLGLVGFVSWLGNLVGLGLVIAALVSSLNSAPTRTEDASTNVTG